MKRVVVSLFLASTIIFANTVTQLKWKSGVTFQSYLKSKGVSLDIDKDLDELEKEVIGDIRSGQIYYEVRDENGKLLKAYIPISSSLQIKLGQNSNGVFKFSIIPINFKEKNYFGNVVIKGNLWSDISSQIHNDTLLKALKTAMVGTTSGIGTGDSVAFLYSQKTLGGQKYGNPKILVIKITNNQKEQFVYVDSDGKGHNEPYENVSYVTDNPLIGKSTTKRIDSSPSKLTFNFPLRSHEITSPFGWRMHPVLHRTLFHNGVDFGARIGTPVYASASGTVTFAGVESGYGNVMKIQHGGGYMTLYAHLSGFRAYAGEHVDAGDVVAYTGNSGRTTGPHLHFGVYLNDNPINPMGVLEKGATPLDYILSKASDVTSTKTYETKKIPIIGAVKNKNQLISLIAKDEPTFDWGKYDSSKLSEDDFEE